MIPLINIDDIIRKHFETLREDANLFYRLLYFVFIPLFVAGLFIYLNKCLNENSANSLITAFSIFTGLLLNIILIIFAIVNNANMSNSKFSSLKLKLLGHLYANSIYALLLSTILLIILIIMVIFGDWNWMLWVKTLSFIIYFGISHFVITLLMIFKRLYVLLFD